MKATKKTLTSQKQSPQRTCFACRITRDKTELIRLVRQLDTGTVEIDIKGKMVGRGAYLCRNADCWTTGLKGNRVEHTLKIKLSAENREKLQSAAAKMFQANTEDI